MTYLHSILSLPPGALFALAGILILMSALWLTSLFSRRHFVTIRRSEETEVLSFELRRIADAVERLASVREAQAQPHTESSSGRSVGLSMFGR